VRAAVPGEGTVLARLLRELSDAHDAWGGYPSSRDAHVYTELAHRLDDDARIRGGSTALGGHLRVVADLGGLASGQVEGGVIRHGVHPTTPFTCDVRSLIVAKRARGMGVGRALLQALAGAARLLSGGAPYLLAAEVLEPNPALSFYRRLGYKPVAHSVRIGSAHGATITAGASAGPAARIAIAADARAVAGLGAMLAARRRAAGDFRFDPPSPTIDERVVRDLAASFGSQPPGYRPADPAILVSVRGDGAVLGAAFFATQNLDPPLIPLRRALVGGFALVPGCPVAPVVASIVALACQIAVVEGAPYVEIADLPAPGTELHVAALATGGVRWSRTLINRPTCDYRLSCE